MPIRLEGMTLYTVKDIEELLGIGNSTVRRYISQGRLKGRKMARRWYIPAQSLLDYFHSVDLEPPSELLEKLKELREALFNLRFQHATAQLENTAQLNKTRKNIAQVMTILRETAQKTAA